ncbi:MAG: hypothetical protein GC190_14530 [Alphaproteobacteria bacterium]|nr:hypothetical protein [Alphaproteobacteria bacterium]
MALPLQVEQLDDNLKALGRIEAQHALQLRQFIYGDNVVSREDADLLFSLNDACKTKDPAFVALYVEALTDYFVWQTEPRGYVTPELSRYLVDQVTADGHIDGETELELVLNVVHWARQVPDDLTTLVLDAVRQSVMRTGDTPFGANRPCIAIGEGDVAILTKALYAPAGDGSLLVTRREAELLFDINDAASTAGNDPAWREFFVHAIANHLTNPLELRPAPTREEAAHREHWLDERGSMGALLSGVASALARGDIPSRQVMDEFDPTWSKHFRKEADAIAAAAKAAAAREAVDADEARWLAERIMRDGSIDENERALLAFLKKESPSIDVTLQPLMQRAGL